MPKKKQVFEPENLESIRSAISGLIVEPPETIEPVVYSVDLLSRHFIIVVEMKNYLHCPKKRFCL